MTSVSSNQSPDLAWLLEGLAREVPDIRGSVLLSSDGLTKASHGLDRAGSEYLAALAAGLYSMARGAAGKFDGSGEVRQIVAELGSSQLYIAWAGFNTVLAVLAKGEADPAVVGLEMARLIKAVRPFLDTAARERPAAPAVGSPWA
ncbi:roadblock/LC7 domain-containing protein [Actinomadura sp. KC345]|uniref:roadblock/LC7 domain-containing protein n=1 Tax=Actinomadura sp. KC345 TaxID=2530371 RepID=UPI001044FB0F|nr:roadblock/LC7 domain-containing protein [Actinomadura sp. KC345]TDC52522.1 roadblock/LC7 domain-containing protein [Actinomadura sp. KC345]